MIKLLLKHGGSVHYHMTLHTAVKRYKLESGVVQLLIAEAKSNPKLFDSFVDQRDSLGRTVLQRCTTVEMADYLLTETRVKVDTTDSRNKTALIQAI